MPCMKSAKVIVQTTRKRLHTIFKTLNFPRPVPWYSHTAHLVFQEKSGKGKFMGWLEMAVSKCKDFIKALGIEPEDIGSHSLHKGILRWAYSDPGGPSAIAIYLRACWSLGAVQDRYFLHEGATGSDAQCGRIAAGLRVADAEFAILPPHFVNMSVLLESELMAIFPHYSSYPATFLPCLPFLLASVVHHASYIRETYPSQHPIFRSALFQTPALFEKFKPAIETGKPSLRHDSYWTPTTHCCCSASLRAETATPRHDQPL